MESPFSNHNTIVFYLEPVLNPIHKNYQQIITLDAIPQGPLSDKVSPINVPKLSTFQNFNTLTSPQNCVYALLRYPKNSYKANFKNPDSFMTADDIPSLFSYLLSNGYTIQENLSDLMFKSKINIGGLSQNRTSGNRKMICFATFYS